MDAKLKPLIDEATRNPRVHVALWEGGETKQRPLRWGYERYREGGTLVKVPLVGKPNPSKPKAPRKPHYTSFESLGQRRLEAPAEKLPTGKWMVRVYYTSMAGETLYWEEGPMHANTANAKLINYGCGVQFEVGGEPKVPAGARKVILPSQMEVTP